MSVNIQGPKKLTKFIKACSKANAGKHEDRLMQVANDFMVDSKLFDKPVLQISSVSTNGASVSALLTPRQVLGARFNIWLSSEEQTIPYTITSSDRTVQAQDTLRGNPRALFLIDEHTQFEALPEKKRLIPSLWKRTQAFGRLLHDISEHCMETYNPSTSGPNSQPTKQK